VLGLHQVVDLQEEEGLPHMEDLLEGDILQLEGDIPQLEGDTHYLAVDP